MLRLSHLFSLGAQLRNRVLKERVNAIEEIRTSSSDKLVALRGILKDLPDLSMGLCRIQYGKVRMLRIRTPIILLNNQLLEHSVHPKSSLLSSQRLIRLLMPSNPLTAPQRLDLSPNSSMRSSSRYHD